MEEYEIVQVEPAICQPHANATLSSSLLLLRPFGAAGWPILINCKSLLVTRAREYKQVQRPEQQVQWRRIRTRPEPWKYVSCFRFFVSFFALLFFFCAAHRINNKNAGNKLHNTRMLSRKLVLIFKALHYSQPERGKPREVSAEETSENCRSPKVCYESA